MEWQLEKVKGTPVYVQIMELIIEAIQSGELKPDEKIPTERELAKRFEVNRSTVVHALEELTSLGWIVRRQGSGTRVNAGNWGRLSTPRTNWQGLLATPYNQVHPYQEEAVKKISDPEAIDLYTGELPHELIPDFQLPSYRWEDFLAEEAHLSELGYAPLQQAIARQLNYDQKLKARESQLLITSGAQQGLFLILQVLLAPGDSVAIEDPSFLYALPIFQAAGIRMYGVSLDEEGMRVDQLKTLIINKKIKMVLLNPNYQNPTGSVMTLARRKELLQLCATYQIPVVEDNVFGDLNFEKKEPLLKSLAPEQVIYMGSLSKILGASTKIGWICAPSSLIESLAKARQVMDSSVSIFPQVLATNALVDETYNQKLADLIISLKRRAQRFVSVMQPFAEDWEISEIHGGFYVWLTWKKGELSAKQWQLFLDEKLIVAPSFLFSDRSNAFRVNYTRLSREKEQQFLQNFQRITERIKNL